VDNVHPCCRCRLRGLVTLRDGDEGDITRQAARSPTGSFDIAVYRL